jgi:protein Mpv17
MSVADVATQLLIEGKSEDEYDPKRTLRWTLAGLVLHGPYFFAGFSVVDKYFGTAAAPSLAVVAKKTAVAQFVLFPPYLVALFGLMGVLEQHDPDIIGQKIRQRVPEAFLGGCVYWPVANGINFAFVSPTLRVPYLAASASVWNSYLSWTNAKEGKKDTKSESEQP